MSRTGQTTPDVMSQVLKKDKDHLTSPDLPMVLFLMLFRLLLAAFAMKAQCWLNGKFFVHQDPGAFCCKAAFQPSSSLYWLFLPRCKTLQFLPSPRKELLRTLFNRDNGNNWRTARKILASFNCCPLSLNSRDSLNY